MALEDRAACVTETEVLKSCSRLQKGVCYTTASLFYCGHRNYSLRDRNLGTCTKACVYNLKKTLFSLATS